MMAAVAALREKYDLHMTVERFCGLDDLPKMTGTYEGKIIMRIAEDMYSFELPDRWKDLVGVIGKGSRVDLVLLREEDPRRRGLLVSLKCLKHQKTKPDEYSELLGKLRGGDGEHRYLYAAYGREGTVSEVNEDLYWRLRDQLWMIFDSVRPTEGYGWESV